MSDENDGESGTNSGGGHRSYFFGDFGADFGCDFGAVEKDCSHGISRIVYEVRIVIGLRDSEDREKKQIPRR